MAIAVRSGWRGGRAKPRSRLRRRSKRRVPCERRLSTPARSAYGAVNPGVSWRCRAVWAMALGVVTRWLMARLAPLDDVETFKRALLEEVHAYPSAVVEAQVGR
jgi:hypothetical protein